jgi:hypothetical protein
MYDKLVFVSSLLIFVTVFSSLMNASMQSEAIASDQFFFDAQNFTGQPLVNESIASESVANKTNKFSAQVFNHKNFTGNNTTITQNTPLINDQFQDSISSLIITIDGNRSAGYMVEVCEHKSYAGNCMILGPGKHNVQTLGWLNDQISSLRALSPETLDLKNIKPGLITNGSN